MLQFNDTAEMIEWLPIESLIEAALPEAEELFDPAEDFGLEWAVDD